MNFISYVETVDKLQTNKTSLAYETANILASRRTKKKLSKMRSQHTDLEDKIVDFCIRFLLSQRINQNLCIRIYV